jgi:hypothetical protein
MSENKKVIVSNGNILSPDYKFFQDVEILGNLIIDGTPSFNQSMTIALSDEQTNISVGTEKLTFRAPFAMTLTSIPRSSISTASSSGSVTVDINKSGNSILGDDKLSIDENQKTSTTANIQTAIEDNFIEDDEELTFDIDFAGTGAKGLKITLYYKRS